MDYARLKAEFGRDIAFHGGMSIQKTLPYGSAEDVRNEVRDRIAKLAGGGHAGVAGGVQPIMAAGAGDQAAGALEHHHRLKALGQQAGAGHPVGLAVGDAAVQ